MRCYKILRELENIGLGNLVQYEKSIKFYRKNKIGGLKLLWTKLLAFFYKQKIFFL